MKSATGWARVGAITVGVALIGLAGIPWSSRAQQVASPELVSTATTGGVALGDTSASPAASDDGNIVAFVTTTAEVPTVNVRDRFGNSTRAVAESPSESPTVSGNGCVVAYTVTDADSTDLLAIDRCTGPNATGESGTAFAAGTPVDSVGTGVGGSRPALSLDGSVIAWSTGSEIRRYVRAGATWSLAQSFDAVAGGDGTSVTGPNVDVSAAGSAVVYEAGPGDALAPTDADVYAWTLDSAGTAAAIENLSVSAGTAAGADGRPAMSGDGSIVLYESAAGEGVVFADLTPSRRGAGILAAGATLPALSPDGHHAAYRRDGNIQVRSWGTGTPFAQSVETPVTYGDPAVPVGAAATALAITTRGEQVVFDSANTALAATTQVFALARPPAWTASALDLGQVQVGKSKPGTVMFTNTGGVGIVVDGAALSVTGSGFSAGATTCAGVLEPRATCTVAVAFAPTAEGAVTGKVTLAPSSGSAGAASATLKATGVAVGASTTTTTEEPVITSPATVDTTIYDPTLSTSPMGTVPSYIPWNTTYRPPTYNSGNYGNNYNYNNYSTPTYNDGSSYYETSGTLSFQPASLDFAPTIAGSGSRTAAIELSSYSVNAITVSSVAVQGSSAFAISSSTCDGASLSSGTACSIEVAFAPTEEGAQSAQLVATAADGSTAVVQLSGFGAPQPSLEVLPEVGSPNEVVTVLGSGFPAGGTVEVWIGARSNVADVTVDDTGSLAVTFVIPGHRSTGPFPVGVLGQDGSFDDVDTAVLIGRAGDRTNVAIHRSPAN